MRINFFTRACLATVLASGLMWSAESGATSMVELTVEQMTDASDEIIRGTVGETWSEPDQKGRIWTRTQIEVNEVLKGPEGLSGVVVDQLGGSWAGIETKGYSSARFSVGEDVLIFLEQLGNGHLVPVGLSQGKYTVQLDPLTHQEIVNRAFIASDKEYDARFLPLPDEADRVSLDEFEMRVQDRIEAGWDGNPIPGASLKKLQSLHANQAEVK